MKIRVFPHPENHYDSVTIDTDKLPVDSVDTPIIYISDLIDSLISCN